MGIDVASSGQLTPPAHPEPDADVDADSTEDSTEDLDDTADHAAAAPDSPPRKHASSVRRAALFGLVVIVALSALVGRLGFRDHQSHQRQTEQGQFLQAARQGAVNLTTIDWHHADADVHRIMDGATGDFYNEFSNRAQPFIEVVKQAQSTSVGTVTDAGLESQTPDAAQALVAVSVTTSTPGAAQQDPRTWRMRIAVQKVDDQIKVSNVEFVL
jgi:Mce-associated membrane protein